MFDGDGFELGEGITLPVASSVFWWNVHTHTLGKFVISFPVVFYFAPR